MERLNFPPVEVLKKQGKYTEVRIKCAYCDLKDTCHLRARKEAYEEAGFTTRCPFTPNRPGKKKKKKAKGKGE